MDRATEVREWRELVRYRAKLVGLRSGLKAQAHAVLAKLGVHVPMTGSVRRRRPPTAGPPLRRRCPVPLGVRATHRIDRRARRRVRPRDQRALDDDRPSLPGSCRLQGDPTHRRDRPDHRSDPGRRDRRRHPIRLARPSGVVVRADTTTSRVRHHDQAGTDHQAGQPARALGSDRSRPTTASRLAAASTPRADSPSGATTARSPRSRSPAASSRSPTTGCATATSAASNRPHEPQRSRAGCERGCVMTPRQGEVVRLIAST